MLLEGQDEQRTHTLNRRDVTAGAQGCAASLATPIGAPAVTGVSGENGTLRCHRITTAYAEDQLRIDVRDTGDTTHQLVMERPAPARPTSTSPQDRPSPTSSSSPSSTAK